MYLNTVHVLQVPSLEESCMHVLYCIPIHLYSASCSAHQSETLPVRETQREESSFERTKRGSRRRKELDPERRANDCKGLCLNHRSPRSRDKEIVTVK